MSIPIPPTHSDVRYGDHERNVMDVWLAKRETPAPCVMVIHGGGWLNGDKRNKLEDLPRYLAAGIAVVAINYRYAPQTIVDSGSTRGTGPIRPRGDYPEPPVKAPLEDAARALQTLRSRAAEWHIDPVRIALTGGSAGACSCLWLTYHADLADPAADDPVRRQSTRPYCTATKAAQTSLDPEQLREWTPNNPYGGHAFGFLYDRSDPIAEIRSFLRHRAEVLPWIKEYSPYEHVAPGAPPVYLWYDKDSPAKGEERQDPTHSSNHGALLVAKLAALGLEYEFVHPGTRNPRHPTVADYLVDMLTRDA